MNDRIPEPSTSPSGDSAKGAGVPHELLARVAHQLRSPLGTILGWAHLLRRRGGDEEYLHGLDMIEESESRLDRHTKSPASSVNNQRIRFA